MRKFISLLSALAVLASLAVVPITASAKDEFTYDGSDASGWSGATDNRINASTVTDTAGDYTKITTSGNGSGRIYYDLPADTQLGDDYVIEYDVNTNKANGMGRYGQYNQVAFISSDATTDTNDYGSYAETLGQGNTGSNSGQGYVTGVASSVTSIVGIKSSIINYTGAELAPSTDDSGILSNKWYRVQAAVSGTTATVTVLDSEGNKIVDAVDYTNSADAIAQISVAVGRGDDSEGAGTVLLDNIRIYAGAAEELTADGLRAGDEEIVEPEPEEPGTEVAASAKAATKVVDDELRISDGTNGAVFRFDVNRFSGIKSAKLIVKVAPRSYDGNNNRWANSEIWTYKIGTTWTSASTEITSDAWNNLSKGDPINKQWSSTYPDGTGEAVAPYQTLTDIDVTDIVTADEDGIVIFAFKTSTGREHAIDAVLEVTADEVGEEPIPSEPTESEDPEPATEVTASAKAATSVVDDELRISDGTKGAVYRFDVSSFENITAATLTVKVAPRAYDANNKRWGNSEIWTYKVGSDWNGSSTEITEDTWNKLSKNDPINKQWSSTYPDGTGEAVAPYQTLNAIDVTDIVTADEDGIVIFAFKTSSARTHAIDVVLNITGTESDTPTEPAATEVPPTAVQASAKAATSVVDDELRISDGTKGAVFRFDVSDLAVESAKLIVKAAPRTYDTTNKRWGNSEIWTYKVGSEWNGSSTEITEDTWNKLSKNDPINKQWSSTYPDGTGEVVAPYQTLNAIDVTDIVTADEDGIVIFAFKTSSARVHAIDAVLEITEKGADVWTKYTVTYKTDGTVDNVIMESVENPSTADTTVDGARVFIWNQNQTPYVPATADEDTPSE